MRAFYKYLSDSLIYSFIENSLSDIFLGMSEIKIVYIEVGKFKPHGAREIKLVQCSGVQPVVFCIHDSAAPPVSCFLPRFEKSFPNCQK